MKVLVIFSCKKFITSKTLLTYNFVFRLVKRLFKIGNYTVNFSFLGYGRNKKNYQVYSWQKDQSPYANKTQYLHYMHPEELNQNLGILLPYQWIKKLSYHRILQELRYSTVICKSWNQNNRLQNSLKHSVWIFQHQLQHCNITILELEN